MKYPTSSIQQAQNLNGYSICTTSNNNNFQMKNTKFTSFVFALLTTLLLFTGKSAMASPGNNIFIDAAFPGAIPTANKMQFCQPDTFRMQVTNLTSNTLTDAHLYFNPFSRNPISSVIDSTTAYATYIGNNAGYSATIQANGTVLLSSAPIPCLNSALWAINEDDGHLFSVTNWSTQSGVNSTTTDLGLIKWSSNNCVSSTNINISGGSELEAAAWDGATNEFYFTSNKSLGAFSAPVLLKIKIDDLVSGQQPCAIVIGSIAAGGQDIESLAINPLTGDLFGGSKAGGDLYKFNKATAAILSGYPVQMTKPAGAGNLNKSESLTFDYSGNLYVSETDDKDVYIINSTTGSGISTYDNNTAPNGLDGLTWDFSGNRLIGFEDNSASGFSNLFEITAGNGSNIFLANTFAAGLVDIEGLELACPKVVCTPPTADAGADQARCQAAGTATLTGTSPTTGTWTAQAGNPAGATVGSTTAGVATVTFTAAAIGTFNFIYTATGGCTDVMSIVVADQPNAGADQARCQAAGTATLTGTSPTTGTWTAQAGNPAGATVGSTTAGVATVTFTAAATGTFNFVYTDGSCTDVMSIVVTAQPDAGADQARCQAAGTATLTGTSPTTGTWTAQAGNPAGATVGSTTAGVATVTFTAAAVGTFNFIYTATGGCTDVMSIVVTDQPDAGIDQARCQAAGTATLTGTSPTTGTWTAQAGNPAGATVGSTTAGVATVTFTAAATGTFNFVYTNGSCTDVMSIVVTAQPDAGADQARCQAAGTATLTGTSPTTGTWTAQAGNPAGATVGSTTAGVATVTFTAAAVGTFNFIYTATGGCTDVMSVVVVNPPTVTLSSISGSTCEAVPFGVFGNTFGGSATSVTLSHNGGGALVPAVASSTPFGFMYTAVPADYGNTVTITATTDNPLGAPCGPAAATFQLKIDDHPPIQGNNTICVGGTSALSISPARPGTWISSDPNFVSVSNTGVITGMQAGSITVLFIADDPTVCSNPSITVTVNSCTVNLSGNVFNDIDAITDNSVDNNAGAQAASTLPAGLTANLFDATTGAFVATVPVQADGTYSFASIAPNTNYTVVLSNVAATVSSTTTNFPSTIPTGWANTGDVNPTDPTATAATPGISAVVEVGTTSVINVDFGIQQPPTAVDNMVASQVNPGGTTSVTVPATNFDGNDLNGGTVVSMTITSFPTNATSITINGTTYTSGTFPVGGVTIPTDANGNPTQTISIDPIDGAVTSVISYIVTDNAGATSDPNDPATVTVPFTTINLSGNVFNDIDAITDNSVDNNAGAQAASTLPAGLTANLFDATTGAFVATVPVQADGTYSFASIAPNTNYTVVLSNVAATVSSTTTNFPSTIPTGWANTGDVNPTDPTATAATPGISAVVEVGTTSVINVDFGIQQPPTAVDNMVASQVNPGGTTSVTVPATNFDGNDLNGGTVVSMTITSFPTNATSITINGTTYTSGTFPVGGVTIPTDANGNPTQTISIDPIDGAVTSVISYIVTDNAGATSDPNDPATVTVPFTTINLSGNVFNDIDAITDNSVDNNAGAQAASTLPAGLTANLFDATTGAFVATVPVAADGTYSFASIAPNTDYTVILSNVAATSGSTTTNFPSTIPTGWANTGDVNPTDPTATAATPGVSAVVEVGTTSVINVDFGIQQPPTAVDNTVASQVNPGGTTSVTVPATNFDGNDLNGGTVVSMTITSFPTNATSITINGTTYTSGTFPVGGVTIPTDANGNPTQTISIDPIDGAVTSVISYIVTDNAGATSDPNDPATVTVPFTTINLSGNVFNDIDAITDNSVDNNAGAQAASTLPAGLTANLFDATTGAFVATVPVAADGTYSFASIAPNTNYTVILSNVVATVSSTTTNFPSIIPTGWANTGDVNPTDPTATAATPGVSDVVEVGTTSVVNVDFGIQQPPIAVDNIVASQVNPGGTTSVAVPATNFDGNDLNGGTVVSMTITSFPTNATTITINGTTYTSGTFPVGGVTVPTDANGNPTQVISIDPIDGAVTSVISYIVTDDAGATSDPNDPATVTVPFTTINLSGNVFNDIDAITDNSVDNNAGAQAASTLPAGLTANLFDATTGAFVATVPVAADGTYSFASIAPNTNYTVILSNVVATVSSTTTNFPSIIPTGWANTGDVNPTDPTATAATPGVSAVVEVGTTSIVNVDFGIQQPPIAVDNIVASQVNPGGTTSVAVPATNFDGNDLNGGTVVSMTITSFPTNATSITINGTTYTSGTFPVGGVTIPTDANGNPTQTISIDPIDGAVTSVISYIVTDNAGATSDPNDPATVTVPFTTINLSGNVFNDIDAITDNSVDNNAGAQAASTLPAGLTANLFDATTGAFVATVPVAADGTYSFASIAPNTNYTVILSNVVATVSSTTTNFPSIIPTGWANTGDVNPTDPTATAATPGVSAVVEVGTTSVINVDFGIQQPPTAVDNMVASQVNPGGTTSVTIPSSNFDGNDLSGGTITNITITSFPTNATTITINGTTYTSGTFPNGGVSVPTDVNGNPTQTIAIDPIDGAVTSVITYTATDNGGATSSPATLDVPFSTVTIAGSVFNDPNAGNVDNSTGSANLVPTGMYANLIDNNGKVVTTATVGTDGTYTLNSVNAGDYTVVLSTTEGTIGDNAPASSVPAGYANTGEFNGTPNTGNTAPIDGTSALFTVSTANVTNINFGIQQPPVASNDTSIGNIGQAVTVNVLINDSDVAPGTIDPTSVTMIVPQGAIGVVTDGNGDVTSMTIPGEGTWTVNPTLGEITFTPLPTFIGNPTPITYTVDDNAGFPSNPATVTITYPSVIISGTVINDINGSGKNNGGDILTGSETGTTAGTNLYVYLIDNSGKVIDSAKVQSDGTYILLGSPNSTYTIELSTTEYPIGSDVNTTPISNTPPSGWATIGEGASNQGDGISNGTLSVSTGEVNSINNNFGIVQKPIADDKFYSGLEADILRFNPTGNASYPNEWNLNNSEGTNDGPINVSNGTMPGLVSGNDINSGRISGATGSEGDLTFTTNGRLYDPLNPLTLLPSIVLVYKVNGDNIILNPSPSPLDPSFIYWNSTTSQFEIPNFNANNLSVWFDTTGSSGFLFNYGWKNGAGVESNKAIYSVTADAPLAILPVELVYFTGSIIEDAAVLTWLTASELNNSGFEIEHSMNGIDFESIGWVNGNGSSNIPHTYGYKDQNLSLGVNYYRLKQIDYDGKVSYSQIISLEYKTNLKVSIYPVPAHNILNVNINLKDLNKVQLTIVDVSGRRIRTVLNVNASNQIDLSNIPNGSYFLQVNSNNNQLASYPFSIIK
jgi:CshA-type fibril repeat protein